LKDATQFHIRPARPEEAGLFYTPHPEEDKRLGTVGHVRMDFGRSGNEFWHTWWPCGPEELNSPVFKAELQEVVDTLRESVLKSRFAMERFCYVPYKIGKLQIQGFSEPTTPNKIKQSYHITQKAARSRPRAAFLRGKLGRRQDFSKK